MSFDVYKNNIPRKLNKTFGGPLSFFTAFLFLFESESDIYKMVLLNAK